MSKDIILKIAGVKNDKEFYQKFPTEEAFMKKHGKAFKKAQLGAKMPKALLGIEEPLIPMKSQGMSMQPITAPGTLASKIYTPGPKGGKIFNPFPEGGTSVAQHLGSLGNVVKGFQALGAEKRALKEARLDEDVTALGVQAQASARPEYMNHNYVRPEDMISTGEEFFPNIYGGGTNVLAKDGAQIKGRKLEFGGEMPWDIMGDKASGIITQIGGENAGGDVGGGIGGAIGSIWGPVGSAIGKVGGQIIGGLLDRKPHKIKEAKAGSANNMAQMAGGNFGQAMHQQYNSFVKNGGDIPQMEMGGDLQVYDGDVETISNNPYGSETVQFSGNSHSKGGMPIAYGNSPVEVEGGETATELKNGGEETLTVYGNLKIPEIFSDPNAHGKKFKNYIKDISKKEERENRLIDKTTKEMSEFDPKTSFDKLKLSSYKANLKGAQMKLKEYAEYKEEAGELQKAINDLASENNLKADALAKGKIVKDPKASLNQGKYGMNIPKAQDGISLDTKLNNLSNNELYSMISDGFVNKKHKEYSVKTIPQGEYAEYEPNVSYETEMKQFFDELKEVIDSGDRKKLLSLGLEIFKDDPEIFNETANRMEFDTANPQVSKTTDKSTDKKEEKKKEEKLIKAPSLKSSKDLKTILNEWKPKPSLPTSLKEKNIMSFEEAQEQIAKAKGNKEEKFDWVNLINNVLPNFRPSDAEDLNMEQLYPEIFAMSNNQLEGVQAQGYRPQLDVPYDISYQDQLNEITASERGTQRMAGYNPAAMSMIGSQFGDAKAKILAEQFRVNQGLKNQVYAKNRATENDAQLKNLSIFSQQADKQAAAKSNTKATTQAALNSIAAKYAQNRLEKRQIQTYENMYNYRYDARGRAQNMNPIVDFQAMIDNSLAEYDGSTKYDSNGLPIKSKTTTETTTVRYGGSIKKNQRKISIAKAMKEY